MVRKEINVAGGSADGSGEEEEEEPKVTMLGWRVVAGWRTTGGAGEDRQHDYAEIAIARLHLALRGWKGDGFANS